MSIALDIFPHPLQWQFCLTLYYKLPTVLVFVGGPFPLGPFSYMLFLVSF